MTDTSNIKERLLAMRSEYTKRVHALDKDLHHEEYAVEKDFAEQATQMENQQVLEALDDEAKYQLGQIDSALRRIEQGSYGICASCGEPIATSRLDAVPYTIHCIDCAEAS